MTDWNAVLTEAGSKLRAARDIEDAAYDVARDLAIKAIADGQSESLCASTLGVDRMTVRKWVGKR